MTKNKIRTAVIGLGVGIHHARTLSAHPGCELVWLCDLDKGKLAEVNSEIIEAKQNFKLEQQLGQKLQIAL